MVRLERTGQNKTTFTSDIRYCVLCRGQKRTAVDSRREQLSEFSGEAKEWSRLGQSLHGSVTQVLFARVLQEREKDTFRSDDGHERASAGVKVHLGGQQRNPLPELDTRGNIIVASQMTHFVCVYACSCYFTYVLTHLLTLLLLSTNVVQTNEFKLNSLAYCLWTYTWRQRERYFAARGNVKPN